MTTRNETRAAAKLWKAEHARAITLKQPRRRKLLSGQTVPKEVLGQTWHQFISPRSGSAKSNPDHPSRKHDIDVFPTVLTVAVVGPVPGQARRRDRRAAARSAEVAA